MAYEANRDSSSLTPLSDEYMESDEFASSDGSPIAIESQEANTTNILPSQIQIRTQSSYLHDDTSVFAAPTLNQLLRKDLVNRVTLSGQNIAEFMFPDSAFGFPINNQFVANFYGTFVSSGGLLDQKNFADDKTTSVFLNRMISTIAHFLQATKQVSLKPLRYFAANNSTKPLDGHVFQRKPDLMLLHLIDGYLPHGPFHWRDPQAFVEHTREKKAPMRLPETVSVKSYLAFCCQPERDYVIFLCIIGGGFQIVVTDHVGQVETVLLSFVSTADTQAFIRMVMGMAFLPDNFLGADTTMTRPKKTKHSNILFSKRYTHFLYDTATPSVTMLNGFANDSLAITSTPESPPDSDDEISFISVGTKVYKVIRLLFRSQTLIGRATRAFLVQFPDGRRGVLKDSWVTADRESEADFLKGLDIPYGPDLIDQCNLGTTDIFRQYAIKSCDIIECREKRRIVTYPAGVHISDFSSLLELMFAFFDILLSILYLETRNKVHRDISYTNILLRDSGIDSSGRMSVRKEFMKEYDLSNIEDLRKQIGCREGLLIDYDYATVVAGSEGDTQNQEKNPSGGRTGTLPFIAMELLNSSIPHRVAHDLESLLYVLVFICTHLRGPGNDVGDPPIYGGKKDSKHESGIREWMQIRDPKMLGYVKFKHILVDFQDRIVGQISPYFKPLSHHISNFQQVLFPTGLSAGKEAEKSAATCLDVINVFKSVFKDEDLIKAAQQPNSNLGKRSRPGDLISDGWDVVKIPNKLLTAEPKNNPSVRQTSKLMTKCRRLV